MNYTRNRIKLDKDHDSKKTNEKKNPQCYFTTHLLPF